MVLLIKSLVVIIVRIESISILKCLFFVIIVLIGIMLKIMIKDVIRIVVII